MRTQMANVVFYYHWRSIEYMITKEEGEKYEKKFPRANVEQSYGKSF